MATRNPHVVSDCQPSNPPGPEPAGTNTHYPRTQHQRRVNFKLGKGVKHSVATRDIRTRIRIGGSNYLKTTSPPPRGLFLKIFVLYCASLPKKYLYTRLCLKYIFHLIFSCPENIINYFINIINITHIIHNSMEF